MKLAAAYAIADHIKNPKRNEIITSSLDMDICQKVADAVYTACEN
jgi:malic enzyme